MNQTPQTHLNGAKRPDEFPVVIDNLTGKVETPEVPKAKRVRINLATIDDIDREVSRVYRDVRVGKVPSEVGSRLVYILRTNAEIKSWAQIKARITMLEQLLEQRRLVGTDGDDEEEPS